MTCSENKVLADTGLIGKKRNVLFIDTVNTFYLRLYGVGHMVKDHSDTESGLRFSISSKGPVICTDPQTE